MTQAALTVDVPTSQLVSSGAATDVDDAGALVCAFLVGRRIVSCARLANDLGTRPIVVEECIRQRNSSRALRAQLSHYLQEHSALAARVPSAMLTTLQQAHALDVVPSSSRAPDADEKDTSRADSEDMLDMLDPSSRNHFLSLESAVGQSFSSIMNDPAGSRATAATGMGGTSSDDWSGWLGGKLSSAFDYSSTSGTNNRAEEALHALRASYLTNDQSSTMLLAAHDLGGGFDEYVRLTSAAYAANRKESRSPGTSVFGQSKCKAEDLPWPKGVPAEVFERQYEPRTELSRLPSAPPAPAPAVPAPTSTTSSSPAPSPSGGAGKTDLPSPKLLGVDRDTFTKDTELLEARSVELRAWETEVERCLLEHVRSKSEDFFSASLQFTLLSGGAGEALACAKTSRESGVAPAQLVVQKYLEVGVLHRRRQNYQALCELVGKVEKMCGRLERVENWVALQERDMTELPKFVDYLLNLQSFLADQTRAAATTTPSSSGWVSRLKCLRDVPTRVGLVDTAMKDLVAHTIVFQLISSAAANDAATAAAAAAKTLSDNTTAAPTTKLLVQACEAAAALDVFEQALHDYQVQVVQGIWPLAQTTAVNALMNTQGALTDEAADKLVSLTLAPTTAAAPAANPATNAAPNATPKSRKAAAAAAAAELAKANDPERRRKAFSDHITSQVRFPVFLMLLSQLQEAMCTYVTHIAQQLAVLLVDCLSPGGALAQRYGHDDALRAMCVSLFTAMRGEMEFIFAQLITAREQSAMPTDAGEVEALVECAYRWQSPFAEPLMELERVQARELAGLTEAVVTTGKSPLRVACQKLCRHYFRAWHTQQVEKLTMVLDNETWEAREDISTVFQAHLGQLCSTSADTIRAFDALSLESPSVLPQLSGGGVFHPRSSSAAMTPRAASGATTHKSASAALGVDDDDLLAGGTANRLFLCLDDDKDAGRVVCGAFLILVEQLFSYDQYVAHFPSVALETTTRMQELLALFDGKTAALILGGKAVEKGTLRSISTQHLCVASQCVALLSEFVPLLQQHLLSVLHVQELTGVDSPAAEGEAGTGPSSEAAKQATKLRPFIEKDMSRTIKDARAHRNECFHKILSLVKAKVDSLGRVEPNGQWPSTGNEWVMTMLRETARLLRALKPYLPQMDVQGVVAPLLGTFAAEIREVTRVIPEKSADARASATSDVLLFRANVEKFGYDVLLCASTTSPATAMRGVLSPQSSEQDILAWFFPPPKPRTTSAGS